MKLIDHVKALQLPPRTFVVVGSSTMVVLGLADNDNDVDLTVDQAVFDRYKSLGWRQEFFQGEPVLKSGVYDIGVRFYKWRLEELLRDAIWVDDVPFMSLEKLLAWKKHMLREADLPHIALLEAYLAHPPKPSAS